MKSRATRRFGFARKRWSVIACLVLLLPLSLFAQTTGTVEGIVTDQSNGPLPGVTVDLSSPKLQGTRSAVTGPDGRYRFLSLTPGDYAVTATLAGFGKVEKKATVTLDATATANLQLNLSTTAEVTVTGEAPLIDSTSTTAGSNFAGKVIDKLPLASRNYAAIVLSQPGVQFDNGESQGRSPSGNGGGAMMAAGGGGGISVYGSTSSENSFLIDGVNTTNVIKGIQGKDINNEFVQEVEVKTGGYQAEYGRNTGGIVNVITKSGGNEFHGGIFGYYNSLGLASDQKNLTTPDFSEVGNAQATTILNKNTRSEGGVDLGGYAWKDRVWFFAAYDRVITGSEIAPTTGPVTGENFPSTQTENKYSLKLTLNLAQSTTLQGVYFSDRQSLVGTINPNPQSANPYANTGRMDVGGPDYGARLNQLFGASGILTLSYGQHADRFATQPSGRGVSQTVDLTSIVDQGYPDYFGGFGQVFGPVANNYSQRQAYAGSYTGYVGNHEFKVGGDYEKVATNGTTYWTGTYRNEIRPCLQGSNSTCDLSLAPFYTNAQGSTYQVYYQHDYFTANGTDLDPLVVAPFNTPTRRYSGFLQDQWRITPALTVNAGVRYDTETLYNGLQQKAFSLTNQWAPRFGVTWDFAATARRSCMPRRAASTTPFPRISTFASSRATRATGRSRTTSTTSRRLVRSARRATRPRAAWRAPR